MTRFLPLAAAFCLLLPVASPAQDNLVLNGDFEDSAYTPGCHFNLHNLTVDAMLPHLTAFGTAEEIDYMNDASACGYGFPPKSGVAKLGIACQDTGGDRDAFAFDLSERVLAGGVYRFTCYAMGIVPFGGGDVLIGLSDDPTDLGTPVFSGTPSEQWWTFLYGEFIAPVSADYLTVTISPTHLAWDHLDKVVLRFISGGTAVDDAPAPLAQLHAPHPNPFNPSTAIRYTLAEAGTLRLSVVDVAGRQVRALRQGWAEPGEHLAHWDGRDDAGRALLSGVYLLRLEAAGGMQARKLVLAR